MYHHIPVVTTQEKTSRRIDGIKKVMQKTARIMSGTPVIINTVKIAPSSLENAPGWTDGKDITLNMPLIDALVNGVDFSSDAWFDAVMAIKGLVFHELSHILYTPRSSSKLVNSIRGHTDEKKLWWAFNALEDQRIERLFTSMYAPTSPYFSSTVLAWIVNSPEVMKLAHCLVYGRTYLDATVRMVAKDIFLAEHGKAITDRLERCIDTYAGLTLDSTKAITDNNEKAFACIVEFAELIDKIIPPGSPMPNQPTVDNAPHDPYAGKESDISKGRANVGEQNRAQKAAKNADAKAKPDKASATSGNGKLTFDDLMDAAKDASASTKADAGLRKEIKTATDAIREAASGSDGLSDYRAGSYPMAPTVAGATAVRRIVASLAPLKLDFDSETERRVRNGKIDMKSYAYRKDWQRNYFERKTEDISETGGIEIAIMLDVSGSMNGYMNSVSEMLWALKRGFEKVDVITTVIGFNHEAMVLYRPKDKVTNTKINRYYASGRTNPTDAFNIANKILLRSTCRHRAIVTITDGMWSSDPKIIKRIMRGLHNSNTTSMILGISAAVSLYGTHDHQSGQDVDEISQLPKAITSLVAGIMRSQALRVD